MDRRVELKPIEPCNWARRSDHGTPMPQLMRRRILPLIDPMSYLKTARAADSAARAAASH
jgi:hypothetical protein